MRDRYFLDTNIIVYSFDSREADKARRSRELISKAASEGSGIISTQVIQEFLNLAIAKFEKPLSIQDCRNFLKSVLFPLCEVFPDPDLYDLSLEIHGLSGFSFYDCRIVAAACKGGCKVLYTSVPAR